MEEKTIKCPRCGETLVLDKDMYASVALQVRDSEFKKAVAEAESRYATEIARIEASHKAELDVLAEKSEAELQSELTKKELEMEACCSAANERAEKARNEAAIAESQKQAAIEAAAREKEVLLHELDEKLKAAQALAAREKDAAISDAKAVVEKAYNEQIAGLQSKLSSAGAALELAVSKEKQRAMVEISAKEKEITNLQHRLDQEKAEHKLAMDAREREHALVVRQKDEEIDFYKDFKQRLSTKMLGESLEQHCLNAFERARSIGFPRAYFEKDNDASGGSKGDFIFRDFDEKGVEFISVMFEMKNEADETLRKHKNEDFFKKLDADRNAKGCEFAVLVSTLEPDSELYNTGIVDVSHRYPKMFVVRPQFFLPLIGILRNAAANTAQYREEAQLLRDQHIDVQLFASKLGNFKERFAKSYASSSKQLESAIGEIDKTIEHLEKTKKALQASAKHLAAANDRAEGVTLKQLTRGNPTMKKKFKDAGIAISEKTA